MLIDRITYVHAVQTTTKTTPTNVSLRIAQRARVSMATTTRALEGSFVLGETNIQYKAIIQNHVL